MGLMWSIKSFSMNLSSWYILTSHKSTNLSIEQSSSKAGPFDALVILKAFHRRASRTKNCINNSALSVGCLIEIERTMSNNKNFVLQFVLEQSACRKAKILLSYFTAKGAILYRIWCSRIFFIKIKVKSIITPWVSTWIFLNP